MEKITVEENTIPLQNLCDFYKDLNTNKFHDEFEIKNEIYLHMTNEFLNRSITKDDTLKAVN